MPDPLSVKDVVYVYERLSSISYQLQRTRSSFRVFKNHVLAVGESLHLPVGPKEQHLSASQSETKDFQKAVEAARSSLGGFARIQQHVFRPNANEVIAMIRLVNYAQTARPADTQIAGDRQGDLADRGKITIKNQQIRSRLMIGRHWSQEDMDRCGTWSE